MDPNEQYWPSTIAAAQDWLQQAGRDDLRVVGNPTYDTQGTATVMLSGPNGSDAIRINQYGGIIAPPGTKPPKPVTTKSAAAKAPTRPWPDADGNLWQTGADGRAQPVTDEQGNQLRGPSRIPGRSGSQVGKPFPDGDGRLWTMRPDGTVSAVNDESGTQLTGPQRAPRSTSSTDVAQINATSRTGVADIRVTGRLAAIAKQEQASLDEIHQRGLQQLDLARQKYEQTKDLTAYTYEQQAIRNQVTQEAMQARQLAVDAQKDAYNLPKQQADIEAERSRAKTEQETADTERQRVLQEAQKNQQDLQRQAAEMQLGAAQKQADMADSAIQSGVKLGVAPPEMLVKAQFAPFQMAQEVLQQLANSGSIDHTRIPDVLGIKPQGAANMPGGTPVPTNGIEGGLPLGGGAEQDNARLAAMRAAQSAPPPLGQFSGYGTPGGYQGAPNPNVFGSGLGDAPVPVAPDASIPGYARGTGFARGGVSLVGERGPELVSVPRGSRIVPVRSPRPTPSPYGPG